MARDPRTGERLSRAESSARIRQQLLDVGVEMVLEQPLPAGLDHVRVTDVARRSGVTTGAVYHHWESQDEFRDEVVALLLHPNLLADDDSFSSALEQAGNDPSLTGPIAEAVGAEMDRVLGDNRFTAYVSFWARREFAGLQERIGELLAVQIKRRTAALEQFFTARGARVREPFDVEDVAVALSGIIDGLAVRRGANPETVGAETVRAICAGAMAQFLEGETIDIGIETKMRAER